MSLLADPSESPTHEIIGSYRLVRQIGQGGSSVVFLAERIDFPQRVAIKLFHDDIDVDGRIFAALQNNEDALAALDHPHIVRMIDRARSTGVRRYQVMEFVDGLAIDKYCDHARLALPARIDLLLKVLQAVEYAHRRLIVHGDLKPANILVTAEANAKLLDFETSSAAHTPDFASPEQRTGDRVTLASDIYSLGLAARLLLAGIAPSSRVEEFASTALDRLPESEAQVIAQDRGTALPKLISELRGDLDAILRKALNPDPNERFVSADQFSADLRNYLAGRSVSARRANRIERTRKWVLRHKLLAALTTLLAVVIVISTIGVLWQSAKAAHERGIAQNRLRDLVRLTGTLDGELYDSVKTVPQSEPARASLLAGATQTLNSLSQTDSQDPVLAVELAGQYEKLARLQLTQTSASSAHPEATDDLKRGIALVRPVSASSKSYPEAQSLLRTMLALQQSLHP